MDTLRRRMIAATLLSAAPIAHAQADRFPSKPIRIIVPFNAGSGADETSRVYGDIVAKMLGQSLVVENRPGASGALAIQAVKSAPADGHTILMASNSPMAVNPIVIKNLGYDPFKDFRPVYGASVGAAAFVVPADAPYKTMGDLVAAAKKDRRALSVGNYSAGYQLIGAWLGTAAGIEVNHVPYKGGAQMVTDVIGKQIDVGINDFSGVAQLISAGKLRALAITGGTRDPKFPDIPTMKESGFPDFETYVWASFFVRTETPDEIVDRLASTFQRALVSEEAQAYRNTRPGTPLLLGPKEMGEFHLREYERFRKVAEAAGIKPQ
ncbi:MAG: extra-cytoplasmic solute receptor protein [Pseudomonadota bacterium]